MVAKRNPARDSSEDSVLLLPRKKSGTMFGSGHNSGELKFSQRVAYGLGHFMNDICAAMWFTYTLLFYEVVLEIPSTVAGLLICIGQVADAAVSPVIGILVDRYGTRKSWHLIGTTLIAFTFSLIYSNCPWMPSNLEEPNGTSVQKISWKDYSDLDITFAAMYFSFLIIIFQTGWAVVQIAHLAIIPELTPDKSERANLTALRYTASVVACLFVFLASWLILHVTEDSKSSVGPDDAFKFRSIVLLGLFVGGVSTFIFHAILIVPNSGTDNSKENKQKSLKTWFKVVGEYFKSVLLYQVTLVYFASRMLVSISMVYLPMFVVEKFEDQLEYIAIVPLVCYMSSFVASLIVRILRKYWSSKVHYVVGTILCLFGCGWIFLDISLAAEMFGIAILLGAGGSITSVASLCLCADLIGTDTENGAFVYSIVTAADKFLGGVVVIFIEHCKSGIFAHVKHYYQDVMAYGCGISSLVGLIVLITMMFNKGSLKDTQHEERTESRDH